MQDNKREIEKYKKILKEIKNHNKYYFNDDSPKISDAKYDLLKQEILKLEKKFKYLKDLNLIQNKFIEPEKKIAKVFL